MSVAEAGGGYSVSIERTPAADKGDLSVGHALDNVGCNGKAGVQVPRIATAGDHDVKRTRHVDVRRQLSVVRCT